MLETAYSELLGYVDDPQAFYGSPVIWNDIQALYVPYLRAFPKNVWVRNKYTHLACLAGKWQVAKQQFDLLGGSLYPERLWRPGGVAEIPGARARTGAAALLRP